MFNINDARHQRAGLRAEAQTIIAAATKTGKDIAGADLERFESLMAKMGEINTRIDRHQAGLPQLDDEGAPVPRIPGLPRLNNGAVRASQKPMSPEYTESFLALLRSGGKQATAELTAGFDPMFGGYALPQISASMYRGGNSAGGYSVSVPTDNRIVPLGLPDLGVRSLARVIETETDIKIPTQGSFGAAGIKAESGASTYTFTESDPTLGQFTLSAFMTGLTHTVSWELLQDVELFQTFGIQDLLNAISITEDGFFVNGTGTNQPQGLIGNVGTGTGSPYLVESTGVYLLNAVDDVLGTLKGTYYPNASWLMSRATGTAIRKAQRQSNLFAQVWTRENGRDYLAGFPVSYSSAMPAIPTATSAGVQPILFGSFLDGYVIGDRGGAGTYVKVLDQPLATAGQTILLGYKRVDGRVRVAEAIQSITISHS